LTTKQTMKVHKRVLCPERLRRIPGQFSWIDQRLVRDRYLQRCDHAALALYLVLITVADAEGLSYYSDASLERMLNLDHPQLLHARRQLVQAGLLVHEQPLYQVLSLELPVEASGLREALAARSGQAQPVAAILRQILGGTA
jgi:hypothetical protein